MIRREAWFAFAVLAAVVVAGCLSGDPGPGGTRETRPSKIDFLVRNASSDAPVPFAQVTLLDASGPIVAVTTDQDGAARVQVPSGAISFEAAAVGFVPHSSELTSIPTKMIVRLKPTSDPDALNSSAALRFRPAVDLGSKSYIVAVGTSCLTEDLLGDRDANCGLGEPSVEVDRKGTIYVSGVCCIGNAPPVYVSRDDGKSFRELRTPTGIREAFGIEGDFAIDGKGVVYFADIELAATFQVTAWDASGQFLRHMKWPAPPLVDRDWIRAEGDGKLYYVYNTGGSTNVYTSQDGGATWSPRPVFTAPYGLGNAVKGLRPGELWILGGASGTSRRADYTLDGGATWKTETTTAPLGGGFPTGAFDDAGSLYVTGAPQDRIYVARRSAEGVWGERVMVTPDIGHHRMPWVAAGGPGKVAVAWYGTLEESTNAKWYLFTAVSLDADSPSPHWQIAVADPEPVLAGNLGRQLLDFLQVDIGPDGAVHVAYSKLRPTERNGEEQLHYVHSEPSLPLAALRYQNGPA